MANHYPTTFADRRKQLGEIHLLAAALGMDTSDESAGSEYRSMLFAITRQHSAAGLDWRCRKMVLDHLRSLAQMRGIKPVNKNAGKPSNVKPELQPLMGKVGALLADMKLPWKYAAAILRRQSKLDRLEWANAEQLGALIASLAKKQKKGAAECK
ncbi:MAG: regulatory protein GemA [Gallionellaceae bacterium]